VHVPPLPTCAKLNRVGKGGKQAVLQLKPWGRLCPPYGLLHLMTQ
jgi:hypothetical protein